MRRIVLFSLMSLLLGAGAAVAHSDSKPTGIMKERHDGMEALKAMMKKLAGMVKGKSEFDAAATKAMMTKIEGYSADIPKWFPKGSNKGKSEALPKIWTDWDDFTKRAKEMGEKATLVSQAVDDGGVAGLRKSFGPLGATCSNCHKHYRKDDD